jgi:hypothetical protein
MKILPSKSSIDSLKRKLIRNSSRKKPELESAASLEKLPQDIEQEDRFYYTTSNFLSLIINTPMVGRNQKCF